MKKLRYNTKRPRSNGRNFLDRKADATKPGAVTNVRSLDPSTTTINILWDDPIDTDIAGYAIYRDATLVGYSLQIGFLDTGLAENTTYSYQISVIDSSENAGTLSTGVNLSTLSESGVVIPSTPMNVSIGTVTDTQIDLSWDSSTSDTSISNYQVFEITQGLGLVGSPTGTSFSHTGLTASTAYSYYITAVDADSDISANSATVAATTTSGGSAIAPTASFIATPTSGDVPLVVNFESISLPGSQAITSHFWNFGDGNTQTGGTNFNYTYQNAGSYIAELTVTNGEPLQDSSTEMIMVNVAAPDTESPSMSGSPTLISNSDSTIQLTWAASSDNIGVDNYEVYEYIDDPSTPTINEDIDFALLDSTTLNSGTNLVRAVYSINTDRMINDINGVRLTFDVETDWPSDVSHRTELRESDITSSNTYTSGTSVEYNVRFTIEDLPSIVYSPITIFQIFNHELGTWILNLEITGYHQFDPSDANKLQVAYPNGGTNRTVLEHYLAAINDLKVLIYYHPTNGKHNIYLNGVEIHSATGIDYTPPTLNGVAAQFGFYPHGFRNSSSQRDDQIASSEITFTSLLHNYSKRVYSGEYTPTNFVTNNFNINSSITTSGTSITRTGLTASSKYRYSVIAKDVAGNRSGPSISKTLYTLATPTTIYPTTNLVADVPMWSTERTMVSTSAQDRSGNGNHINVSGTLETEGILASGSFIPDTWPTLSNEMTFVAVERYYDAGSFTREYQFSGQQNSFFFEKKAMFIRNNASGLQEREVSYVASNQDNWFHAHIVIIKADGSVELHRSMLEPLSGQNWEVTTDNTLNHTGMINGNSLGTIAYPSGRLVRHIMLYDVALSGTALEDLKAALLSDHKDPNIGLEDWADPSNVLIQTNFSNIADNFELTSTYVKNSDDFLRPLAAAMDRSVIRTYTDSNSIAKKCVEMPFDGTEAGYNPGQRFLAIDIFPTIGNTRTDLTVEWDICFVGLSLNTSLGAKIGPSIIFGSTPSPCNPVLVNTGYINCMNRPPRTGSGGAIIHGYNYYVNNYDPCGDHHQAYNEDGSLFRIQEDTWYKMAQRIKLNDVGQSNGSFQMMIDDTLVYSQGNILMRDNGLVYINRVDIAIFSGGDWSFDAAGTIYLGDIRVKDGF